MQHEEGEGLLAVYGPPEAKVELVQAFEPVEVEYAAIRTHVGILDLPSRGIVAVRGSDRHSFLNRMLTQELKGLSGGNVRLSFWLNRKGRIDSDLRVIEASGLSIDPLGGGGDVTLLEMDVHAVARTIEGLSKYVITEDVTIEDASEQTHMLALHGPAALSLLAEHLAVGSEQASLIALPDRRALSASIATQGGPIPALIVRVDETAEIGLSVVLAKAVVERVYEALSTPWSARGPRDAAAPTTRLARRIGWHAFNIARIEAGTPLYHIDFGPDSLPHETGRETLADRVSFKKGCYLGQEVVARMESLGHPKQMLVGLRLTAGAESPQPSGGAAILTANDAAAAETGTVTSSAISPMLGSVPLAFGMVKWSHANPGTKVWIRVDGPLSPLPAEIAPTLRFWSRNS